MKTIREKILPLLLSVAMVVGLLQGIGVTPVYAASTASVSIGTTSLTDGKYYTAMNGGDSTNAVVQATDAAPAEGTPYLYYKDGVLTVHGNINLASTGPSALAVSGGAITIAGSGSLSLTCSGDSVVNMSAKGASSNSLLLSDSVNLTVNQTGPAPALQQGNIQTLEGYSGNITISAANSGALLAMSAVNLQTTGDIDILSGGNPPTIMSTGKVTLKGKTVNLQHTGNGILLQSASSSASITAMEGGLSLKGNSIAPILSAPEGVTLSAGGDIEIENTNGIGVSGNLTVTKAKDVSIYSTYGSAVSGGTDITATGNVTINRDGDDSSVPSLYSPDTASIKTTGGYIKIYGTGTTPVISAGSLTLQAAGNILVERIKDDEGSAPVIAATNKSLTSDTGLVIISGSKGTTITTKDGSTVNATYGDDVTDNVLDLYGYKGDATPTEATLYLAGNGYLLFTPAQDGNPATLLMNNASMEVDEDDVELITLPEGAVTIELSGENKLTAKNTVTDGIACGIVAYKGGATDLTITSSNSGRLNIDTSIASIGSTSGAIGTMDDYLYTLAITGNASVTALSQIMDSPTDQAQSYGVVVGGNLTVGDDASFYAKGNTCDVVISGGTVKANHLDGIVGNFDEKNYQFDFTVYGTHDLPDLLKKLPVGTVQNGTLIATTSLNIPVGSKLTIPAGKTLTITDLSKLTNNGTMINNGIVILPAGTNIQQIKALKLTGSGMVKVVKDANTNTYDTYTNNGVALNQVVGGNLKLTDTEVPESANKGYTWTKAGEGASEIWTLTLDNTYISGNLSFPDKTIVIKSTADNFISGSINPGSDYPCHLTLNGSGSLTVGAYFSDGQGGEMTVADGVHVTFNDSVFIGASGGGSGTGSGDAGTLNVTGTGTMLNVSSPFGYAVFCDTVNVNDKASLITSTQGEHSRGVMALTGVTVTGGANLTAGCDYGIYIIGGKLMVDNDSKLTTNGSVAPFCIVDKTSGKSQSQLLSLPGIPDGTQIASVMGTDSGYGYNYWSLVPTGGSLSVANENSEPVTLKGAVVKALSFYKTQKQEQQGFAIGAIGKKTYGDGDFTLFTTGGNGEGAVTFTSSDASIVSISGATASIHKAGTVTITAKKAEDSTYKEATASVSLTVDKKADSGQNNSNSNNSNSSDTTSKTKNETTSGTITKVQQTDADALIVNLNNTVEELKNILFTTGEIGKINAGKNAKVILKGTIGSVSENDKKLAQKKLEGQNPDLYFDLSLYKQIGNDTQTRISSTNGKLLNISITVPENLRASDSHIERTYYLVNMYDGTANMVKGSYDSATHKLTFETDRLSAYALGHKDSLVDGSHTIAKVNYLHLKAKATKHTQKLSYTKVSKADGYLIYGAQCGSGKKLKKLAEVSGKTMKYTDSNLKKATSYKYQVKAYKMINGKKKIMAVSKVIYSITASKVYSNPLKVQTDVFEVSLAQGNTKKLKGKVVLPKNKKMKRYTAAVRYELTDNTVAAISNKGVISALAKGTCYVYASAQNGVYKKIKVTVK